MALVILMIIGALVAIETSNLLHSVISIGAVGFLLSIVFLFLSAPDLAITQIAVEVITLVLLLQAARRSENDSMSHRGRTIDTVVAVLIILMLAGLGARMSADFPQFGEPVMDRYADAPSNTYLQDGLEKTGAENIVTAVLLDFRAYDTLGEATVLFCAVVGALSILRRPTRKRPDRPDKEHDK
ncbi:MAG: hydrogen gas-evolving membrane-bound hydrogenase subunit E [Pirellulaceae bacterium]